MNTPDLYGGTAVTTQNLIRMVGKVSTTDVAGAGSFSANVGDEYEILVGTDSNSGTAEPYGPLTTYTIPCEENPDLEVSVVDDALSTDLTAIAWDPDDGNQITGTDKIDLNTGQTKNIKFRWTGSFEEDYGNRFCEDDIGVGNVLVVRYNTTAYDNVYVTDMNGNKLPNANVQISRLLSTSSGYSDIAFQFPVLRSNSDYENKIVVDTSDSQDPSNFNITLYLYDDDFYIDNDVTPAAFKCGIMDEDGLEVGAATADSYIIQVE